MATQERETPCESSTHAASSQKAGVATEHDEFSDEEEEGDDAFDGASSLASTHKKPRMHEG